MSMREPSVDKLLEKIDSKYKIAYIAAKRARQISNTGVSQMDYVTDLPEATSAKSVGLALEEILHDVINYELEENWLKTNVEEMELRDFDFKNW